MRMVYRCQPYNYIWFILLYHAIPILLTTTGATMENKFGIWLTRQLTKHGVSYRMFQNDTGLNRSSITHYLTTPKLPSVKTVYTIAEYLSNKDMQAGEIEEFQVKAQHGKYILHIFALLEL